ncbi:hypothetical protein D3C86_1716460 [compost metagenome]
MPGQPLQIMDILVEAQMHIAEVYQPGACKGGWELLEGQLQPGNVQPVRLSLPGVAAGEQPCAE